MTIEILHSKYFKYIVPLKFDITILMLCLGSFQKFNINHNIDIDVFKLLIT